MSNYRQDRFVYVLYLSAKFLGQANRSCNHSRYLFHASVQTVYDLYIISTSISVVMSNNNKGLASADEERVRIVTGTGTPAEEKEEERARKEKAMEKGHNH